MPVIYIRGPVSLALKQLQAIIFSPPCFTVCCASAITNEERNSVKALNEVGCNLQPSQNILNKLVHVKKT